MTLADGYRFADRIHNTGCAIVWSGPREDAELYWESLDDAGLTMAPLESRLTSRLRPRRGERLAAGAVAAAPWPPAARG